MKKNIRELVKKNRCVDCGYWPISKQATRCMSCAYKHRKHKNNRKKDASHKDEICRWANSPEGTDIWYRVKSKNKWALTEDPLWLNDTIYIVNDKWAKLRKAQVDGKQLQWYGNITGWQDKKLTMELIEHHTSDKWRIKPKGPLYEWQWIYKTKKGEWKITYHFYDDFKDDHFTEIQKWEPSKRIKK